MIQRFRTVSMVRFEVRCSFTSRKLRQHPPLSCYTEFVRVFRLSPLKSVEDMIKIIQSCRPKVCRSLPRIHFHLTLSVRQFSGFLSDKDFLDASPMAAARSPAAVAVKETIVVPAVPVYVPIRLGVQLTKYATNLTKMAADGELEKVIGRDDEIQQAIQILSRRRKNNPCLVGEPGVGKCMVN